jgi:hypothetical protein
MDEHFRGYFDIITEGSKKACESWEVGDVSQSVNAPVSSSIPALLMAGEFDWAEPPAWAELTAQTLTNSSVVVFSNVRQFAYATVEWSDCSHKIVKAFLENPENKPDTGCANKAHNITWITLP